MVSPTALRTNENYVIYYNFVTKTLLTELFPYVSLIFFNVCIYREIRRSVRIQQAMRCTQSQKEEIKSANVVVSVFLQCFWYTEQIQMESFDKHSKAAMHGRCIIYDLYYMADYWH